MSTTPTTDRLALTGGDWTVSGAIRIWEPGANQHEPAPTLTPADVAQMIACPVCRARVDRMCQTTTGRTRSPHPARLIIKRCPCGSPINAGRKVCNECRDEARRVNARIGMRNTRARRRADEVAA
jgi:hypothetical protein